MATTFARESNTRKNPTKVAGFKLSFVIMLRSLKIQCSLLTTNCWLITTFVLLLARIMNNSEPVKFNLVNYSEKGSGFIETGTFLQILECHS